jgi:hypothetical protein
MFDNDVSGDIEVEKFKTKLIQMAKEMEDVELTETVIIQICLDMNETGDGLILIDELQDEIESELE